MNPHTVIADYLRQLGERRLTISLDETGFEFPRADTGRRYLLYLHIPFCRSLCPFCSFHRVIYDAGTAGRYFEALRGEIGRVTDAGYRFDEIYVGGGTPTISVAQLRLTLDFIAERHDIGRVSVETNPDDLVPETMDQLRAAGVKRLSVGVQSFEDPLLTAMQRLESYGSGDEIRERLQRAEGVFDTLNVDMIFNLPDQTEASLRRDLEMLTEVIGVDQVSYYPLMTLSSTRERMLKAMGRVDYSREESFYRLIADHMTAAGYSHSSAWCFSRVPGMFDEYIVERDDYVGLGSGAFSFLDGSLYASTFSISDYCGRIETGRTGTIGQMALGVRDRMRCYLLLRLFSGRLDKSRAETQFENRFQRTIWPEISLLQGIGAVRDRGSRLELTEKGRYLWVILMREFFTGVNNLRDQMRGRLITNTG